jgi:diaminopimelate decarboxylase
MRYFNKRLKIDKFSLENIAKKYGTPAYCYSYKQLKENINTFKNNFKSFSPLICFAVKSNTNLNLIKEIKNLGLGADVVSKGEMMMALKAGINPKKIVFSGVGKKSNEISYAIDKKILLINAESKSEIIEISKIANFKKKKN